MVDLKKSACFLLALLFLTTAGLMSLNEVTAAVPEPEWEQGTPLLYPVYLAASVQDDAYNLYIMGGRSSLGAESTDNASVYDLQTQTQTRLSDMPIGVAGGTAVIGQDGLVYVFGGRNNTYLNLYVTEVQIYDPDADSWSTGADMPQAVTIAEAVAMPNGLIYVMGGLNSYSPIDTQDTMQIYDPVADSWVMGDSMSEPHYSGAAVAVNDNTIMYIGGSNADTFYTYSSVMYYSIADDYWYGSMNPFPEKFAGADAIFGPDGLIYLVGGGRTDSAYSTSNDATNEGFCYDLFSNDFISLPDMDLARKYHSIGYDDEGHIYVLGGYTYDTTLGWTTTETVERLKVMDLTLQVLPEGVDIATGEQVTVVADFNFAIADYEELSADVKILNSDEEVVASYSLQAYIADGNPGHYRVDIPQDLPSGDYVLQFSKLRPSDYSWDDLSFGGFDLTLTFVHALTVSEQLEAQNQTIADQQEQIGELQDDIGALQDDIGVLQDDLTNANDKLDASAGTLMIVMVLALIAVIVAVVLLVLSFRKKN